MLHRVRIPVAIALSLLVMLTGQAMAQARGMDMAVGQIVICSGTGPVIIFVDETGQPTQAPQYCPDYVIGVLGAVALPEAALTDAPGTGDASPGPEPATLWWADPFAILARAPPGIF
ncbi:MAG: hypothetical protein AAF408_07330 [Pseudomonadota bacterium]